MIGAFQTGVLGSRNNGLLNGLVAHWALDESDGNAIDSGSSGLTLTQVNSPSYGDGKVYEKARSFWPGTGAVRYFSRANESALQIGGTSFVISGWFLMGTRNSTGNWIISKRGLAADSNFEYQIIVSNTTRKLRFSVGASATTNTITNANDISLNSWTHFVASFDNATKDQSLAVNFTDIASTTFNNTLNAGSIMTAVGAYSADPQITANAHIGRIGPISFWKGRSASDDMRAALWNGGKGLRYQDYTK